MQKHIKNGWDKLLHEEMQKEYFVNLQKKVEDAYSSSTCFPPYENIFNALNLTSYEDIKVVIIGQDPYHEKGQATGLAFSVNEGVKLPPSLRNIYKEIASEFGTIPDTNGNLEYLAKQGVLLLNTTLTVEEGKANSHKSFGWETFTDSIIKLVSNKRDVIFMLWGADAIKKQALLKDNIVLTTTHPSPLSAYRGFLGSGQFLKVNEILSSQNKKEINWTRNEG